MFENTSSSLWLSGLPWKALNHDFCFGDMAFGLIDTFNSMCNVFTSISFAPDIPEAMAEIHISTCLMSGTCETHLDAHQDTFELTQSICRALPVRQ